MSSTKRAIFFFSNAGRIFTGVPTKDGVISGSRYSFASAPNHYSGQGRNLATEEGRGAGGDNVTGTQVEANTTKPIEGERDTVAGIPVKARTTTVEYDRVEHNKEERKTGDMMDFVAGVAKEATVKALETGLHVGEMAKQTVDIAWDATKKTTESIKEAMAGDEKVDRKGFPTRDGDDNRVDDVRKNVSRSGLNDRNM